MLLNNLFVTFVPLVLSLVGAANAAYVNGTSTIDADPTDLTTIVVTATDLSTTQVTITSCGNQTCIPIVTVTTHEVQTIYTTTCPISEASTVTPLPPTYTSHSPTATPAPPSPAPPSPAPPSPSSEGTPAPPAPAPSEGTTASPAPPESTTPAVPTVSHGGASKMTAIGSSLLGMVVLLFI